MKRAILHGLVAVALVAATLAVWHWRFIAVPGLLPETRLANPLVGWSSTPNQQYQVIGDRDTPVLRLQRDRPGGKSPGVQIWLGPLDDVRFIHVRCESRRKDVERGPMPWMYARFVIFMKDRNGAVRHPPDSVIFAGSGSRDWSRSEAVVELTGDMVDINFAIAMLGKTGTLEVRRLSLTAVRQRSWVPAATVFVVLSWIAFCASLVLHHRSRPAWWRATAAASVVVAFSWITVFPQTKGLLRPVLGQFDIGELPAAPAQIPRPPRPAPATPTPPEPAPAAPDQAKAPSGEAAPRQPGTEPSPGAEPSPETRHSGLVRRFAFVFDRKFRIAHLAMFTALTLAVLLITGSRSQFSLPLAVAFLSELVPEFTGDAGDWNDWRDLLQNLAGIALAVLLWSLASRWRKRKNAAAGSAPV